MLVRSVSEGMPKLCCVVERFGGGRLATMGPSGSLLIPLERGAHLPEMGGGARLVMYSLKPNSGKQGQTVL